MGMVWHGIAGLMNKSKSIKKEYQGCRDTLDSMLGINKVCGSINVAIGIYPCRV